MGRKDYEDARRDMQERGFGERRGGGNNAFTAAVFIRYPAIVVVVIAAYVVIQLLNAIQGAF